MQIDFVELDTPEDFDSQPEQVDFTKRFKRLYDYNINSSQIMFSSLSLVGAILFNFMLMTLAGLLLWMNSSWISQYERETDRLRE